MLHFSPCLNPLNAVVYILLLFSIRILEEGVLAERKQQQHEIMSLKEHKNRIRQSNKSSSSAIGYQNNVTMKDADDDNFDNLDGVMDTNFSGSPVYSFKRKIVAHFMTFVS